MRPVTNSEDEATLAFYRQEAENYCKRTGTRPTASLEEFLSHLPAGASILELGCGSGRDTAEMLRLGYDVFPTDGTPAMAREAEKRLGRPVAVLRFGEIAGEARFDGVWACACLLHVPIGSLGNVLKRIHGTLRLRGMFFASFKAGNGEGRDALGRFYNYPSPLTLKNIFKDAACWESVEIREAPGVGYDHSPLTWLNCLARRA